MMLYTRVQGDSGVLSSHISGSSLISLGIKLFKEDTLVSFTFTPEMV